MSYQAIARKWRPQTFDEIAGQGHVTQTLQNAIRLDRVHHGFLFTGARGVGKTTAARVLARALNCEAGPTPEPCGSCGNCKEILAGSSPDVVEIDGASNNSVDSIRDLRDAVRYLPQRGRKKVYIVDEVHMLSKGAFNALLKTLEEPPDHVVFIFATTEPQKIPDTILSRVQRFDFKRISPKVVVERLARICEAEGVTIPESGLRLVARAGEGSMRDAQGLLDRVISFTGKEISLEQVIEVLGLVDRGLLYQMLEGILRGDADPCLEAIATVHGYGYDLSEFTSEMLELLRNATLVDLSPSSQRYLDVAKDERARLEELSKEVPSEVFVRAFQVMLEVHDQVSRAERPRIVLEMAVARLVCIRPARPLDQILERITALERRIRQQGGRPSGGPGGAKAAAPSPERGKIALDLGESSVVPSSSSSSDPQAALAPQWIADSPPLPDHQPGLIDPADPQIGLVELEPEETQGELAPETELRPGIDEVDPALPEAQRFRIFQEWLEKGGPRFEVWAHDSALDQVQVGVVHVLFPSEFKRRNALDLSRDPHLILGLQACFPGCNSVRIALRDTSLRPVASRRELDHEDRLVRLAELRRESEADPLIQQVMDQLDAEIVEVVPADEEPPALEGR